MENRLMKWATAICAYMRVCVIIYMAHTMNGPLKKSYGSWQLHKKNPNLILLSHLINNGALSGAVCNALWLRPPWCFPSPTKSNAGQTVKQADADIDLVTAYTYDIDAPETMNGYFMNQHKAIYLRISYDRALRYELNSSPYFKVWLLWNGILLPETLYKLDVLDTLIYFSHPHCTWCNKNLVIKNLFCVCAKFRKKCGPFCQFYFFSIRPSFFSCLGKDWTRQLIEKKVLPLSCDVSVYCLPVIIVRNSKRFLLIPIENAGKEK